MLTAATAPATSTESMAAASTFLATDGEGYELQMGRWSHLLAEPFLDFVGTAHGERVLDVGCGTGRLSFAWVQRCRVQQLLGIDIAPAYVDHANRHNTESQAPRSRSATPVPR